MYTPSTFVKLVPGVKFEMNSAVLLINYARLLKFCIHTSCCRLLAGLVICFLENQNHPTHEGVEEEDREDS